MGYISDRKLAQPFQRMDLLQKDYVRKAKDIAIRMNKGEVIPHEEINEIRILAVNDRDNLKGDFVISVFLELVESGVKFDRWTKGKSIHTNVKEVKKVFKNHLTQELSVTEFCRQNAMTRNKYYRIVNCDVKNPEYVEVLELIRGDVEKELAEND